MKRSKICKAISIGLMLALLLTQLTFVTAFAAETTYTAEQIITGTNAEVENINLSTTANTSIYDIDVAKGYFYKFDVKFSAASGAVASFFSDDDGDTRMRFDLRSDKLYYPQSNNAMVENTQYTHGSTDITYHYIIAVAPNDTVTYYRAEDNGAYQKVAITDSALYKTLANNGWTANVGNRGFDIRKGTLTNVTSATVSVYYTKYEKDSILAGFEQTNATNKAVTSTGDAKVSTLFDENKKWATAIDVTFNDATANYTGWVYANNYRMRFQADAGASKLLLGGDGISSNANIGTATEQQKKMEQLSVAYTMAEGTTHNFIVVMTNSGYCDLYAKASNDTTYKRLIRRFAQDWNTAHTINTSIAPWTRRVNHGTTTNVTIDKVEVYSADIDNNLLGLYNKVAENTDKTNFNYTANATDDMAYMFDVKLGDADDTFSASMYLPDGNYRTSLYIAKDFIDYMYHTPAEGETEDKWVSRVDVDNTPGVEYSYVVKIIDGVPYYYRKVKNSDSGYVLVAQGNALQARESENPEIGFGTVAETVTCTASVYTSEHPTEAQLIGNMEPIVTAPLTAKDTDFATSYPIQTDEARIIKFDYKLTTENADITAFIDDGKKRCRIEVKPNTLYYTDGDNAMVTCSLTSDLNTDYTLLVYINEDNSAIWYRKAATDTTYTPIVKSADLYTTTFHRIRCGSQFTDASATVSIYQNKANLSFRDSNGAVTDTLENVNKVHLSLLTNDLEENESNTYMMIVGVYNGEVLAGAKLVPITVTANGVVTQEIAISDVVGDTSGITDIKGFIWTDAYAPVADALEM